MKCALLCCTINCINGLVENFNVSIYKGKSCYFKTCFIFYIVGKLFFTFDNPLSALKLDINFFSFNSDPLNSKGKQ